MIAMTTSSSISVNPRDRAAHRLRERTYGHLEMKWERKM